MKMNSCSKKVLGIAMALLMMFPSFALIACKEGTNHKGDADDNTEVTTEENDGETTGVTGPSESCLKINGANISEYTITYPANGENEEKSQAERLAAHINTFFECDVKVVEESEFNSVKSIAIRDTLPSSDVIDMSAYKNIDTAAALIINIDDTLSICATNKYTLEAAIDRLIEDSTPAETGDTVELDYSKGNAQRVVAESLGDVLKVMSYNVKTGTPDNLRASQVIKNIKDFMPDTLGTQEVNADWISMFTKQKLFEDYEMVGKPRGQESDKGIANEYSAILYRKSTMKLIDSGTFWLSNTPTVVGSKFDCSSYTRILTFAVLERKSDGTRFVHVNTHMEWDHDNVKTNLLQMKVLLDIVDKQIYSKHGELPTFFTGDFNVEMTSDGYKHLISTGKEDTRVIADITCEKLTHQGGEILDYCIVTEGDFKVAKFDVGGGLPGSDHYPVYVEMYFTPKDN